MPRIRSPFFPTYVSSRDQSTMKLCEFLLPHMFENDLFFKFFFNIFVSSHYLGIITWKSRNVTSLFPLSPFSCATALLVAALLLILLFLVLHRLLSLRLIRRNNLPALVLRRRVNSGCELSFLSSEVVRSDSNRLSSTDSM